MRFNSQYLGPPQLIKTSTKGSPDELRASNWISIWDGQSDVDVDVAVVGVPFAKGGEIAEGTNSTPNAIRKALTNYTTYSHDQDYDMRELTVKHIGDVSIHPTDIHRTHYHIECALREVRTALPTALLVVLGGDGSIGVPSVRAVDAGAENGIGLICFDALLDVRDSAEVGPSDATVLRSLLEERTLRGENLVHIGAHGFSGSRYAKRYLEGAGVTSFRARQVRSLGMASVIATALEIASNGVDGVYVSLDASVLDSSAAPFSRATSAGGLSSPEMQDALFAVGAHPKVIAVDLVGLDTHDDPKEYMARQASCLLLSLLAGRANRDKKIGEVE